MQSSNTSFTADHWDLRVDFYFIFEKNKAACELFMRLQVFYLRSYKTKDLSFGVGDQ